MDVRATDCCCLETVDERPNGGQHEERAAAAPIIPLATSASLAGGDVGNDLHDDERAKKNGWTLEECHVNT